MHISKYEREKGTDFAKSEGLGKRTTLEEISASRKNIKKLIEYTSRLDNKKLMEINKDTPVSSGYGIIMPSEDF